MHRISRLTSYYKPPSSYPQLNIMDKPSKEIMENNQIFPNSKIATCSTISPGNNGKVPPDLPVQV